MIEFKKEATGLISYNANYHESYDKIKELIAKAEKLEVDLVELHKLHSAILSTSATLLNKSFFAGGMAQVMFLETLPEGADLN